MRPGDTVAVMLPNVPAMVDAHFGIPMAGAVINALNVRLEPETIAYILDHGEAKVLLTDPEYSGVIKAALGRAERKPLVVDVPDPVFDMPGERLGELIYDELLAEGDPAFEPCYPADEWQAIALGYTSGTTGRPKGVVTHHRGAYLNAIGDILVWNMGLHPTYLWTLPMFHCNGWCFPWAVVLQAGTQVCLRRVEPAAIYAAIAEHKVTHLCGAPVVMGMLINAAPGERRDFDHQVNMMTAAAAPPAAVLQRMAELGIRITHAYGLTEVYGPSTVCAWQEEWDALPMHERARLQARQGVCYPVLEGLEVMDPATMTPVPRDGRTIGEIMMRGHDVMKGYLKDPKATEAAFMNGWFHTGDLGVMHEDGYIEIKDRSKDIIISGGENISSIEVESALYRHPAVLEAAVVARPDDKWGETPCAFVTLKAGAAGDRARSDRPLPQDPRPFQMPEDRGVRRAAQDLDRQGAKERVARARAGAVKDRGPTTNRLLGSSCREGALSASQWGDMLRVLGRLGDHRGNPDRADRQRSSTRRTSTSGHRTQAELLRAERFDELDLEHLIEEVEDLGGAFRALRCAVARA